jgi:hypothetical protein
MHFITVAKPGCFASFICHPESYGRPVNRAASKGLTERGRTFT